MVGCTDGTHGGKRFFFCPAGTGYFCSISDLLELHSMYLGAPTTPATDETPPTHATRSPLIAAGTGYNGCIYICVCVHVCVCECMCVSLQVYYSSPSYCIFTITLYVCMCALQRTPIQLK